MKKLLIKIGLWSAFFWAAFGLCIAVSVAQEQPSVAQKGAITAGHIATWAGPNYIQDGGNHIVDNKAPSYPLATELFASLTNSHYTNAPNGDTLFCSDCTVGSTCSGSGTGALAVRISGAWTCK